MAQSKETAGPKMSKLRSMKEFLETQPLYSKTDVVVPPLIANLFPDVLFLHCGICNDTRPFRYPFSSGSGAGRMPEKVEHAGIYGCHVRCTGCREQSFTCWVRVSLTPETWIQKVGQYPSVADLHSAEIKRYRKVLTSEDYSDLRRAVGLSAHGIGIGAFVYLRRIFERLIEEAHQTARQDSAWDEDRFQQSRMPEKIGLLALHLPGFLVEKKSLYSILSKGLHELSENECLQCFSITQHGIELILEERIATKEKNEKIEQTKKDIALLTQKIKEQGA
jgi:hypothetical protein